LTTVQRVGITHIYVIIYNIIHIYIYIYFMNVGYFYAHASQ